MNCQIGIDLCSHRIGRYLLFIICLCAPHSKAACVHCVSCHWCCYWFCSILGSVQCINMRIYMKTTALMMSLLSTISRWTVLLVWQQQLCRFANRTNSTLILAGFERIFLLVWCQLRVFLPFIPNCIFASKFPH